MSLRGNFLLQFETIFPPIYKHYFYLLSDPVYLYIHDLYCALTVYKSQNKKRDSLQVQSLKSLMTSRRLFTLFFSTIIGKLRVESCDEYEIQLILDHIVRWGLSDKVFEKWCEIRGIRDAQARVRYHEGTLEMQTDFTSFFGFLSEDLQSELSDILTENERIARYSVAVSRASILCDAAITILKFRCMNVRDLILHETNVFNLFNLVELFE